MQKQILIIVFCGLQLINVNYASSDGEWQTYSAGSEAAMAYTKEFVEKHRYNLQKIYTFADRLKKDARFSEVVHLYKSALEFYPQHNELRYKLNLAKSDFDERRSVNSFNLQQYKKFGSVNTARLDEIKCKTLQGEEGKNACGRIGIEKQKLIIAENSKPKLDVISVVPKADTTVIRTTKYEHASKFETKSDHARIDIDVGNYHALIIGNNNYPNFPKLETAINDANSVADILKQDYDFKVTELNNANRYEIFAQLSRLRKQLNENDNLLIYYAGHGYLDEDTQRGYWLPVDAEEHNYANWLSTNDITDMLNGMFAKHVLVVADSCYSGTLTRSIHRSLHKVDSEQIKWIQRIAKKRSRTVMTSGGLEPVLDSGKENHSIFTSAFIDALVKNESILEASRLFTTVRRSVVLNADQTPEYADIRKAGHEGGDFIFMRVN